MTKIMAVEQTQQLDELHDLGILQQFKYIRENISMGALLES